MKTKLFLSISLFLLVQIVLAQPQSYQLIEPIEREVYEDVTPISSNDHYEAPSTEENEAIKEVEASELNNKPSTEVIKINPQFETVKEEKVADINPQFETFNIEIEPTPVKKEMPELIPSPIKELETEVIAKEEPKIEEKEEEEGISALNFKQEVIEFGVIDLDKPVVATFQFTNTTDEPIIIKDAKGSCGCTATDFPKEPILPGETAEISATYNAASIGPFDKTVTVINSAAKPTILHIKGEVVWKL